MPSRNGNYQKGEQVNFDQAQTSAITNGTNVGHGDSLVSFYLDKFYHEARGHLLNKYHVALWGDLVAEALRIMDRNSFADKYSLSQQKLFHGDPHIKTSFNNWADLFYSKEEKILNMYWAAQSIKMRSSKAKIQDISIDNTKSMKYPLVVGDQGPQTLSLTIVDDTYTMWYQFFNALYNAQFSPLVLKAKDTWQKLVIAVDVYNEATTTTRSSNWNMATPSSPFITDIHPIQMFEFNSCVMLSAPEMNPSNKSSDLYTFTVEFKYPNAFQGTFKNQLRYLRDNTNDGTDENTIDTTKMKENRSFYEENLKQINNRKYVYEAFNQDEYYTKYGPRYFSTKSE